MKMCVTLALLNCGSRPPAQTPQSHVPRVGAPPLGQFREERDEIAVMVDNEEGCIVLRRLVLVAVAVLLQHTLHWSPHKCDQAQAVYYTSLGLNIGVLAIVLNELERSRHAY